MLLLLRPYGRPFPPLCCCSRTLTNNRQKRGGDPILLHGKPKNYSCKSIISFKLSLAAKFEINFLTYFLISFDMKLPIN